jgi:hypothetical protein
VLKRFNFCKVGSRIAAKSQRPDAGINEQAHGLRARSAL